MGDWVIGCLLFGCALLYTSCACVPTAGSRGAQAIHLDALHCRFTVAEGGDNEGGGGGASAAAATTITTAVKQIGATGEEGNRGSCPSRARLEGVDWEGEKKK